MSDFTWRGLRMSYDAANASYQSEPVAVFRDQRFEVAWLAGGDWIADIIVGPDCLQGRGDSPEAALASLVDEMLRCRAEYQDVAVRIEQFLAGTP